MKKGFYNNESYKHRMAKQVLFEWFKGGGSFEIGGSLENIIFETNGKNGVLLEYPIVKNNNIDSIAHCWDDILGDNKNDFVPNFDLINEMNLYFQAIIDVVLVDDNKPKYFIEVKHTHKTNKEKIDKLKSLGVKFLIEIDADWILNLSHRPDKLEYKMLIDASSLSFWGFNTDDDTPQETKHRNDKCLDCKKLIYGNFNRCYKCNIKFKSKNEEQNNTILFVS
jgi:hypothetical protein